MLYEQSCGEKNSGGGSFVPDSICDRLRIVGLIAALSLAFHSKLMHTGPSLKISGKFLRPWFKHKQPSPQERPLSGYIQMNKAPRAIELLMMDEKNSLQT
jgi:hypothetical protein